MDTLRAATNTNKTGLLSLLAAENVVWRVVFEDGYTLVVDIEAKRWPLFFTLKGLGFAPRVLNYDARS